MGTVPVDRKEKAQTMLGILNFEKARIAQTSGQSYVIHRRRLEILESIYLDYSDGERREASTITPETPT